MATHVDLTPSAEPEPTPTPTPRVHPTLREPLGATTPPNPEDPPAGRFGRALTGAISIGRVLVLHLRPPRVPTHLLVPAIAAAAILSVTLGGPPGSGMDVLRAAVVGTAALLAVFAFRAEMRRNGKGSRGPRHATGASLDLRVRYSDLVDHVEREHERATGHPNRRMAAMLSPVDPAQPDRTPDDR